MIVMPVSEIEARNITAEFIARHGMIDAANVTWTGSGLMFPDDYLPRIQEIDKTRAPVPSGVDLWKLRSALDQAGLLDQVDTYIASQKTSDPALWHAWEYGNRATRTGLFVTRIAAQFSQTPDQIDAIFRAADAIRE